jgi:hypothetical protein
MNNSQRDPRWGNIKLGFSNTYIKDYGCTITAISNILNTTPDVVNERLKAVKGFAYGNLVIWAKIEEAFTGIKIERSWIYDNEHVKSHVPNVIVEVSGAAIGGTGKHWVQFIGNQQCNDPWTGKTRPTDDFVRFGSPSGYCVLTGGWNKPISTSIPPSDDVLLNNIKSVVDNSDNPRTKIAKIREVLK